MRYELECGHCGYLFTLDARAIARVMQCPTCGGELVVSIPVPVVPLPPRLSPAPTDPHGFPL